MDLFQSIIFYEAFKKELQRVSKNKESGIQEAHDLLVRHFKLTFMDPDVYQPTLDAYNHIKAKFVKYPMLFDPYHLEVKSVITERKHTTTELKVKAKYKTFDIVATKQLIGYTTSNNTLIKARKIWDELVELESVYLYTTRSHADQKQAHAIIREAILPHRVP